MAAELTKINIQVSEVSSMKAPLDTLQYLSTGGFTPSHRPTGHMIKKLAIHGFRSMRLINVEWDNVVLFEGGVLKNMDWSRKLERELETCKQLGFVPHIVIGQIVPEGLQVTGEGNKRRGIRDWDIYREYIGAFIEHVTHEHGFNEVVWEVGNEMDNPKFNWVPVEPLQNRLDPEGYSHYLKLYRVIAEKIDDHRRNNPDVKMLVGGPALTQNSMNYLPNSEMNWLVRFAHDVIENDIVCDFFSMHFYGSAGTRDELIERIGYINKASLKEGLSLPIWITEWGASAFFQFKNENYLTDAGSFSLDFIRTAADAGVENTLFIASTKHSDESKSGPALLNRDGSMTYAFEGIDMINSLTGTRVGCSSDKSDISCIAVRSGTNVQLLLWHSDWANRRMGDRKWLQSRREHEKKISIDIDDYNVGNVLMKTNHYIVMTYQIFDR